MRRLPALLLSFSLMGLSLGCCHTAGVCDCDQTTHPCCRYGPMPATAAGCPAVKIEATKTTPDK